MYEELVVEVRPEGDGVPLWVLHPIGGTVLFVRQLVRLLSPGRPVFGLQALGLDGKVVPKSTVPELAEIYAKAILERQAEGPFLLSGPSFGGYLAVEVSRILTLAGHDVALTGLFDAYGPKYPRKLVGIRSFWSKLTTFLCASWAQKKTYLLRVLSCSPWRGGPWRYEPAAQLDSFFTRMSAPIQRVILANIKAAKAYRPEPYAGHLHLFHATNTPKDWPGYVFDAEDNGWGPYALNGVSVILIEGDHRTIMDEPSVIQLSAELDRVITKVLSVRHSHPASTSGLS